VARATLPPEADIGMSEKEDREQVEAKAKRIERWHQTGEIFYSTPDLRWLFVELALANGGELDWQDEDRLRNFVAEPIWGSLWSQGSYFDDLVKQGAILVENSKFQCTGLRDFFIIRIISCLIQGDRQQKRSRTWYVVSTIAVVVAYLLFGGWGLLVLAFVIWSEVHRANSNHRLKQIAQEVDQIYFEVRRGGYDEPSIIRRLETLEQRHIPIPSVLYALLRLPRRNVESEVSKAFNALADDKKNTIWQQWQAFLDFMLKNDDGEAARKERNILESHRAKLFEPIRTALDRLADNFKSGKNIIFTSKSGEDIFPSTYSIEIQENGKQQYYIYTRCEKNSLESEVYSFPMRVVRNPNVFSEWLSFLPGDEEKIVSIIASLLLEYQQRGEITSEDVKRIVQRHKSSNDAAALMGFFDAFKQS
jgi:hypothetical protein